MTECVNSLSYHYRLHRHPTTSEQKVNFSWTTIMYILHRRLDVNIYISRKSQIWSHTSSIFSIISSDQMRHFVWLFLCEDTRLRLETSHMTLPPSDNEPIRIQARLSSLEISTEIHEKKNSSILIPQLNNKLVHNFLLWIPSHINVSSH